MRISRKYRKRISRKITQDEMSRLRSYLQNSSYNVEYSLVGFVNSGSNFREIIYNTDQDSLILSVIPKSNMHVIKDEDALHSSFAILYDKKSNLASKIPEEKYEEEKLFPELRQAFYESVSHKEREADYKYHFADGTEEIAVPSPNPVERLENTIHITAIENISSEFPKKWLIDTRDSGQMLLRERSGSIKLYNELGGGKEIFNAYVGGEHPGTKLHNHEIINIISSVDYINVEEGYKNNVDEKVHEEYEKNLKNVLENQFEEDINRELF